MRANAALTSIADRLPVPSSIMSAGHRGEPFVALEIGGRSDRQHEHERHDGQRPMLGRPERQAIGAADLCGCGENRNGSVGPTSGSRERSARITTPPRAWSPAARARACLSARRSTARDCPCGDTFDGAMQILLRDAVIPRQIALEVAGIVQKHAVGVQLIGLAAEAAERLQPVDELRFDLRVPALHLVFGRPVARSASRAPRRSPAAARRACGPAPRWRQPARTRRARASSETPSLRWRCAARRRAPCRAARLCRSQTDPTADPSRRRRR